jgi:Tol biopolymer transport system component
VSVLDSTGAAAGSVDNVPFTINPGHVTGVTASPSDTAMYVGATLKLNAFAHDRAQNPTSNTVTYGPASGPVSLSGTQVSASATGRAAVVVQGAGFVDTTHISVVPHGTIAMGPADLGHLGITIVDLDGSNYRFLPMSSPALRPLWAPNGAWVVFDYNAVPALGNERIGLIDTTGKQWNADTNSLQYAELELMPQFSRDGRWIYFTQAQDVNAHYAQLWRVGADSNATPLPNQSPSWDYSPSPSPDGSQVAYVGGLDGDFPATLKLLNVTTGAVTSLGVTAQTPRWSPQGQSIAYIAGVPTDLAGKLSVIQADGSNPHVVGPSSNFYEFWIDWSPDGQWIVATNALTLHVELVNVASGVTLPLAFTTKIHAPTWRPATS